MNAVIQSLCLIVAMALLPGCDSPTPQTSENQPIGLQPSNHTFRPNEDRPVTERTFTQPPSTADSTKPVTHAEAPATTTRDQQLAALELRLKVAEELVAIHDDIDKKRFTIAIGRCTRQLAETANNARVYMTRALAYANRGFALRDDIDLKYAVNDLKSAITLAPEDRDLQIECEDLLKLVIATKRDLSDLETAKQELKTNIEFTMTLLSIAQSLFDK